MRSFVIHFEDEYGNISAAIIPGETDTFYEFCSSMREGFVVNQPLPTDSSFLGKDKLTAIPVAFAKKVQEEGMDNYVFYPFHRIISIKKPPGLPISP